MNIDLLGDVAGITLVPDRHKRYLTKIHHAKNRMELMNEWMNEDGVKEDVKSVLAICKAAQEVIEICIDLLAMKLRDNKIPLQDDYSNIELALSSKLLSLEESEIIREIRGLRNRLVHEYNGLNIDILFESLKRLLPPIEDYLERIRKWTMKHFKS